MLAEMQSVIDLKVWGTSVVPLIIGILVGYVLAAILPTLTARIARLAGSQSKVPAEVKSTTTKPHSSASNLVGSAENWIVSGKDLAFFQRHLGEGKDGESATAHTGGPWEIMMKKEIPGLVRYTAWRRSLRNGSTEYKSVTLSGGVSAKEFMDFYLDDAWRPKWDNLLSYAKILENIDPAQRKQVMIWRRNFPFNFISEREYVFARRLFKDDKDLIAVTKSVGEDYEHPDLDVEDNRKVVRIDSYYSMWRSRDVPNPWDAGSPACETVLLHHEDLMVPEHLARLTIKLGMWGFVKNIAHQVQPFVQARRKRAGMYDDDPEAFGWQNADGTAATAATTNTDTTTTDGAASTGKNRRKNWRKRGEAGGKHEGWARGLQRAGWMVLVLTAVKLLAVNMGGKGVHSHELDLEEDVPHSKSNYSRRSKGYRSKGEPERPISYATEVSG